MRYEKHLLIKFIDDHTQGVGPGHTIFIEARKSPRLRAINTVADVLENYGLAQENERFILLLYLASLSKSLPIFHRNVDAQQYKKIVDILMVEIMGESARLRGAASAAMSSLGDDEAISRLIDIIVATKNHGTKLTAIQAVSNYRRFKSTNVRSAAAGTLSDIVSNEEQPIDIRATAAEGLCKVLQNIDRRTKLYKRSIHALVTALESDEPSIRFFSAFSLGNLRETTAIEKLQVMSMIDDGVCQDMPEGSGSVREEALMALTRITRK